MTRSCGAASLLVLLACRAGMAQTGATCRPADDSNEARTLATMAVAVTFSPAGAPGQLRPWQVELGLEVASIPAVDSADAVPSSCRPGKPAENVNILSALARPRVRVGLPAGLALEGSWVPPVEVEGVQANLFGVSLAGSYPVLGRRAWLTPRAHATLGEVHAPVTCPEDALDDPVSTCFGGIESDDRWSPGQFGLDVSLAWDGGRFRPYAGAGWTHLEPTFQVHFTNSAGQLDDTRVEVSLDRVALFLGLTWAALEGLTVSGEAYAVPADAASLRLAGRYALGAPRAAGRTGWR